MKRIYLSGPMTGRPNLNFPAFQLAADRLRTLGYDVVSPAEIAQWAKATWHDAMRADIKDLLDCDTLALLDGWQESAGAHLEMHVAHRVGIKIVVEAEIVEACAKDSLHDCIVKESLIGLQANGDPRFISGAGTVAIAEPVAWAHFAKNGNIRIWTSAAKEAVRIAKENGIDLMPLYAAPQPDRVAELEKNVRELDAIAEARLRDINSAGDALADAGYTDEDQPLWADIAKLAAERDAAKAEVERLRECLSWLQERHRGGMMRAKIDAALAGKEAEREDEQQLDAIMAEKEAQS